MRRGLLIGLALCCLAPSESQIPQRIGAPYWEPYLSPYIGGLWAGTVPGTDPVEWRVFVNLGQQDDAAGAFVRVSTDGVNWTRYPQRFIPDTQALAINGTLPPGVSTATLQLQLYFVDLIGYWSEAGTVWDEDANGATADVPIAVTVTSPDADTTPPATPDGLAVEAQKDAVRLTWDAALLLFGVPGYGDVWGYEVERAKDGGPWAMVTANPIRRCSDVEYFDTDVAPGSSYAYRVSAVDVAGNRSAAPSSVITAEVN